MSTHVPGFQDFFQDFLHHFVLVKLATSSIRVNLVLGIKTLALYPKGA